MTLIVISKSHKEVKDGSIGPIPNNYFDTNRTAGVEKATTQVANHWNPQNPLISDS